MALLRLLLVLAVAVGQFALPAVGAAQPTPPGSSGPPFVPGQVVIQFKPGVGPAEQARARGLAGATRLEVIPTYAPGELELASLPRGLSVAAAVGALERHPAVAFAEPNWIYTHQATSNDPYYTNGSLWGMYGDATSPANQYGSQAGEAWAAGSTGSRSVYVGVIDQGIDVNHPDLRANIWVNSVESANGVDDDGNGYVDDIHGFDFHNNDSSCYDSRRHDEHGTHVAGTIGAVGGNGTGVAGVNWNVTLICGKFLGPSGGYLSNAVRAVNYFTDLKTERGLNIVATSNSWGGGGYSQALHEAIIAAAKAGVLFIAAAGNDGTDNDTTERYPANYDSRQSTSLVSGASYNNVIAVAAIDSNSNLASWSNYGDQKVHLGAPGVNVLSTIPEGRYGHMSGTSMATPHVSGAAALYASANPSATAAQVRDAIESSTVATNSLATRTTTGGRLNVSGFVGGGGGGGSTGTAPSVDAGADATVNEGETFSSAGSFSDPDGEPWTATVDYGDGSGSQPLELNTDKTFSLSHTYNTVGTYTVTVTVTDSTGWSGSDRATVTVTSSTVPSTPNISTIDPSVISAGQTATMTISGSGFAVGAAVAFENGSGPAPSASNISVSQDGTSITATVTAGSGGPPRPRTWDVRVTNPDGGTDVLPGGLTITP